MNPKDMTARLEQMVKLQLVARGIKDCNVLDAMRAVHREKFLPDSSREYAYEDAPFDIGSNQTISQPYVVAFMVEALELKPSDIVLEVGTGSGYAAGVLAQIAAEVYSVERIPELAENAFQTLRALNYINVHVLLADGTHGWQEQAPFDAIMVSAGGTKVPVALSNQLKIGGRMVIPVGPTVDEQVLLKVVRISQTHYESEKIGDVRFVPLIEE